MSKTSKNKVRSIVVDGENYLWVMKHYYDIWEGTLVVYAADSKAGRLEVHYSAKEYFAWAKSGQITDQYNPSRYLNIHEPEPVSRIIRYAQTELGWNPLENKVPLIVENGFELLKKLGYAAKPLDKQAE